MVGLLGGGLAVTQLVLNNSTYEPATESPLWAVVGSELIPSIVTTDTDGNRRVTPLWIIVMDDIGYLRTSETQWYANLRRDPRLILRIGGQAHTMIAELIDDMDISERVHRAFREKYPYRSQLFSLLGRPPERLGNIIRLLLSEN